MYSLDCLHLVVGIRQADAAVSKRGLIMKPSSVGAFPDIILMKQARNRDSRTDWSITTRTAFLSYAPNWPKTAEGYGRGPVLMRTGQPYHRHPDAQQHGVPGEISKGIGM